MCHVSTDILQKKAGRPSGTTQPSHQHSAYKVPSPKSFAINTNSGFPAHTQLSSAEKDCLVHADPLAVPHIFLADLSTYPHCRQGLGCPQSFEQNTTVACEQKQKHSHRSVQTQPGVPRTQRPESVFVNRRTRAWVSPLAHEGPSNKLPHK